MAEDRNLGWIDPDSLSFKTLLKTIYAEARGEPVETQEKVQIAIAQVIVNRAGGNWKGENCLYEIIKGNPQLFRCWDRGGGKSKDDEEIDDVPELDAFKIYGMLTQHVMTGKGSPAMRDPTDGSTHYYRDSNPIEIDYEKFELSKKIGSFQFYKEKGSAIKY